MRPPSSAALADPSAPVDIRAEAGATARPARGDASLFRMAATARLGLAAIPLALLWAAIISLLS